MNNTKGFTLAIALSMVFLFGALGLGMLEYGGGQKQFSFNQSSSTQAFWLADAGLQQSLANGGVAASGNLGLGSFNVPIPVTSGGTTTIISTGTVANQKPAVSRVLEAIGTINTVFQNAVVYGSGGFAEASGDSIANSAGGTFPLITVPTALNSASCPTPGVGYWNVTSSTTFTGSGNYSCPYLYVASGMILTIDTPVVLYLTDTDPLTGPGSTPNSYEDVRGTSGITQTTCGKANNVGCIEILPGGSLTIYAAGRIAFGTTTHSLNFSSDVDILNENPSAASPNPINLLIYSSYDFPVQWSSTTSYSSGDYVNYLNEDWDSGENSNLDNIPGTGPTYSAWSSTTSYLTGTVVTYGGTTWESEENSNLDNVPGVSTAYATWLSTTSYATGAKVTYNGTAWESESSSNLNNKPGATYTTWSGSTPYATGALVSYNGSIWKSQKSNNISHTPETGSTYWTSIAFWESIPQNTVWWESVTETNAWNNIAWGSATSYSQYSMVYYGGNIYETTESGSNENNTPAPDTASGLQASAWYEDICVEIDNDGNHFYGYVYAPQCPAFANTSESITGSIVSNGFVAEPSASITYEKPTSTTGLPTEFTLTSWQECNLAGVCD